MRKDKNLVRFHFSEFIFDRLRKSDLSHLNGLAHLNESEKFQSFVRRKEMHSKGVPGNRLSSMHHSEYFDSKKFACETSDKNSPNSFLLQ